MALSSSRIFSLDADNTSKILFSISFNILRKKKHCKLSANKIEIILNYNLFIYAESILSESLTIFKNNGNIKLNCKHKYFLKFVVILQIANADFLIE